MPFKISIDYRGGTLKTTQDTFCHNGYTAKNNYITNNAQISLNLNQNTKSYRL